MGRKGRVPGARDASENLVVILQRSSPRHRILAPLGLAVNEGRERPGPAHDSCYRIWRLQAVSESPRNWSDVATSLVKSPRPQVIPSHVHEDDEAGP
jgi:hypothetical protein